ncbi:hypothetical protein AXG93_3891s1090 [Marchantia polymorpha subsp. ruderalis]|uniref:Uncharacterized protein n=1 Tax=Marchantia polymorpha subsp. ruderalis TaxID=1480154 RepID=A0A176WP26_MARPO|nr:hypothetical protein AXG93_3891s1090 [Marchantia polymorpha subsp. ruderalis]
MDETRLFYEFAPDRTIVQFQLKVFKKSKKRFIIAFTANADGSLNLETFFIGHAKQSRHLTTVAAATTIDVVVIDQDACAIEQEIAEGIQAMGVAAQFDVTDFINPAGENKSSLEELTYEELVQMTTDDGRRST